MAGLDRRQIIDNISDAMKQKRKLTQIEKTARARRRAEFMTIFVHGEQKRVRRPQNIDGIPVDEFIARNADPLWYHQNKMWECIEPESVDEKSPAPQGIPF